MLDYQRKQAEFAAHLRDPVLHTAPADIEARRLKIYCELFYNNIENFLASAFPVLKSLHDDQAWHALVRDFYARHQAHTPYFAEISEEFLDYLDDSSLDLHRHWPFARSLAHYEWVELALDIAVDEQPQDIVAEGDLLAGCPVLSNLAWPLVYEWPVHLVGKDFQPQEKPVQPVCLVVYRNRDDQVGFLEANPHTLRLLEIISQPECPSGEQALQQIAGEMQHADTAQIITAGLSTLVQLRSLGIILGTRSVC